MDDQLSISDAALHPENVKLARDAFEHMRLYAGSPPDLLEWFALDRRDYQNYLEAALKVRAYLFSEGFDHQVFYIETPVSKAFVAFAATCHWARLMEQDHAPHAESKNPDRRDPGDKGGSAINTNGLTFPRWCFAAGFTDPRSEAEVVEAWAAWNAGEDPSEWRAAGGKAPKHT